MGPSSLSSKTMKLRTSSRKRDFSKTPVSSVLSSSSSPSATAWPSTVRHGAKRSNGGERAEAGLDAVTEMTSSFVTGEQRRESLQLVGLELAVGFLDRRALVGDVLELEDGERETVHEDHEVGPAVVLALDDGELADDEPVVLVGSSESI